MGLPSAVRKSADKAAELMRSRSGAPAQPGTPTPAPTPVAAAPAAQSEAELRSEVERLTQANTVLRTKYDAEVPRQARELAEAKRRADEAEAKLREQAEGQPPKVEGLTDEERLMMGEGGITATTKIVDARLNAKLDELLKPVNDKLTYLQRMNERTYRERIAERVPGWQSQNEDPGFYAWLQQLDPATNRLRHELLNEADAAMQGNRVADIFLAYTEKREIGAGVSRAPSPSPEASRQGDPPPPALENKGKIWTRGEIKQFYRNKGRMNPDEARQMEQDIFAANNEGRIRD
jgi:hypothetical protein